MHLAPAAAALATLSAYQFVRLGALATRAAATRDIGLLSDTLDRKTVRALFYGLLLALLAAAALAGAVQNITVDPALVFMEPGTRL